jgi:hypothetical protein
MDCPLRDSRRTARFFPGTRGRFAQGTHWRRGSPPENANKGNCFIGLREGLGLLPTLTPTLTLLPDHMFVV